MIKLVIFDLDGVLIESAHLKTEAFKALFSKWPDKANKGVEFHMKYMGISRFVKFKNFYENVLGEPYTNEIGATLSHDFSNLVLDRILKAELVKGSKSFLERFYRDHFLVIASGTPQQELEHIVSSKGLKKYFKKVCGTPATKTAIVTDILNEHGYAKDEAVFIGDAESDRTAANNTGIHFILRITSENTDIQSSTTHKLYDLTSLQAKIAELENLNIIDNARADWRDQDSALVKQITPLESDKT